MPSFNLTTQPWISVLTLDGASRELSLLDVIESAEEIARIAGNPLEAAVLHRLILAIAHRVNTPKDPGKWLDLWRDRKGLLAEMAKYVRGQEDRFDLYGSERPLPPTPGPDQPHAHTRRDRL